MAVNPDFRDLFVAFNSADARYLVVGAYAVTFHARPRFTKDLDVWVEPNEESTYGGTPIHVISREDLILNTRALGRPKDLDDLQTLGGE